MAPLYAHPVIQSTQKTKTIHYVRGGSRERNGATKTICKNMQPQEIEKILSDLKESKGWQIIQEWLKPVIDSCELRLLGDDDMSPEEQKDLKRDWKNHKKFYNYPDFIIEKVKSGMETQEHNDDPYE